MDFLQIRFGHLKLTSATPGLSNPCKLRFKSNITGIFKIDICRVVGGTSGFKSDREPVVNSSICNSAFQIANLDATGFILQKNACYSAVNMILKN